MLFTISKFLPLVLTILAVNFQTTLFGQLVRFNYIIDTKINYIDFHGFDINYICSGKDIYIFNPNYKQIYKNGVYKLKIDKYESNNNWSKREVNLIHSKPVFDFLNLVHVSGSYSEKDFIILVIDDYRLENNLDTFYQSLYFFKKTGNDEFTFHHKIYDYTYYKGQYYQKGNKLFMYSCYNSNIEDDPEPFKLGCYDISNKRFINELSFGRPKWLPLSHLISKFVAFTYEYNIVANPTKNEIYFYDNNLKKINTVKVPNLIDISIKYEKSIDSLSLIYGRYKKNLIYKLREIDSQYERIESIFVLNNDEIIISIKCIKCDLNIRNVYVFNIKSNKFIKIPTINYREVANIKGMTAIDLTQNAPNRGYSPYYGFVYPSCFFTKQELKKESINNLKKLKKENLNNGFYIFNSFILE